MMVNMQPSFSLLIVEDDDVAAEAVVRGLLKKSIDCPRVIAEDGPRRSRSCAVCTSGKPANHTWYFST